MFIALDDFGSRLDNNFTHWQASGFTDGNGVFCRFSPDVNLIAKLLENQIENKLVLPVAKEFGYVNISAGARSYPDNSLTRYGITETDILHRVAVDIKTARYLPGKNFRCTLGTRNRNVDTVRNVTFPYRTYNHHWSIIAVYELVQNAMSPYRVLATAARRKYEITSTKLGSGDTQNIGSIWFSHPDEIMHKCGQFTSQEEADTYWTNYKK